MKQDYRVNTFGLTQKQNAFVGANLPTRNCELYIADNPTDLIAINCEAMIVNAAAMEQDDADMIFDYYHQVNGCTDETILWLGEPMPPKASRKFSNATRTLMLLRTSSIICCLPPTAAAKNRMNTAKY